VFTTKVNHQGKKQIRVLACSTARLYNIEVTPPTLELGKVLVFIRLFHP
jgi:hypothetical protein